MVPTWNIQEQRTKSNKVLRDLQNIDLLIIKKKRQWKRNNKWEWNRKRKKRWSRHPNKEKMDEICTRLETNKRNTVKININMF